MRANELMIGDWVYGLSHSPRKVQGLRDYNEENVVVADHWVNCNQLTPIPLTPEILEKNGFVKVNTQRYDWGNPNGFYVNINPKKKIIHINGANGSNCNMYYIIVGFNVHELQHALRLCGLNDLADNFKI